MRRGRAISEGPRETALPNNLTSFRSAQAITGLTVAAGAAFLAAAYLGMGHAQADPKPAVGHFTLSNGLEVVVVPDRRAPVVTHMVWYKVGAADETPGKSGLAHFLEHLMFKGTAKHAAGLFSQTVAMVGGQ
jgi:zinc protease